MILLIQNIRIKTFEVVKFVLFKTVIYQRIVTEISLYGWNMLWLLNLDMHYIVILNICTCCFPVYVFSIKYWELSRTLVSMGMGSHRRIHRIDFCLFAGVKCRVIRVYVDSMRYSNVSFILPIKYFMVMKSKGNCHDWPWLRYNHWKRSMIFDPFFMTRNNRVPLSKGYTDRRNLIPDNQQWHT